MKAWQSSGQRCCFCPARGSCESIDHVEIDARNGAIGLVPPELDGAIVSNDFPSFSFNDLDHYMGKGQQLVEEGFEVMAGSVVAIDQLGFGFVESFLGEAQEDQPEDRIGELGRPEASVGP